jgi:hypothetical protein
MSDSTEKDSMKLARKSTEISAAANGNDSMNEGVNGGSRFKTVAQRLEWKFKRNSSAEIIVAQREAAPSPFQEVKSRSSLDSLHHPANSPSQPPAAGDRVSPKQLLTTLFSRGRKTTFYDGCGNVPRLVSDCIEQIRSRGL